MRKKPYPYSLSQIGLSVPDLGRAVRFYSEVLGWQIIMAPTIIKEDDSVIGVMCKDMIGEGFGSFKMAYMLTGEKIRIEMIEFTTIDAAELRVAYRGSGGFHFCVQDTNVEELANRIVESGGKKRMPVKEYYPDEKPYRIVYCEDPFGNLIEIRSHGFEHIFSLNEQYIH